jgi:hypothetical protein
MMLGRKVPTGVMVYYVRGLVLIYSSLKKIKGEFVK